MAYEAVFWEAHCLGGTTKYRLANHCEAMIWEAHRLGGYKSLEGMVWEAHHWLMKPWFGRRIAWEVLLAAYETKI